MQKTTVAFDVDGTLIYQDTNPAAGRKEDYPREEVVQLFKSLEAIGCEMYIWSGGGIPYARQWARLLGLKATIVAKGSFVPDIAIDDQEVKLGKVNILAQDLVSKNRYNKLAHGFNEGDQLSLFPNPPEDNL